MIDIPIGGWAAIVGNEFEGEYLDLEYLRQKSERIQAKLRRPAVRKLTTPDGRQYKLLFVQKGNKRIREILNVIAPIKNASFVPQLLWADDTSLLFEFIEGDFPHVGSKEFSRDVGRIMAQMHEVRFSNINKLRYRLEFRYNLKTLIEHELLARSYGRSAIALYSALEPSVLPRSLDYFDITRNNFVYDQEGNLKLIDAGAFRKNRMMGQFFVGNTHFSELKTELFWEAYLESSRDHFIFDNFRFIQYFHLVMKAGQRARTFAKSADKTTIEAQRHWQRCTDLRDHITEFLDADA